MLLKPGGLVQVTKKPSCGTLSTGRNSDKNVRQQRSAKHSNVVEKMKSLLVLNKIRFHSHANKRMGERNIIDYEVRQALSSGRHDPKRDRFSDEHQSWEYSINGKTKDDRELRIGISFETDEKTGEKLLIVTVIEPGK